MQNPQEIAELIIKLTSRKRMSINNMLITCGAGKNVVDNLKKGQMPSADKLGMIAQFLGVSSDYLLTGIDQNKKLSMEESNRHLIDEGTYELAKEMYEREEMRVLFELSKNATPEDIEFVTAMLKKFTRGD